MLRVIAYTVLICLVCMSGGCRLCCAPFDYCGPVMEGCGDACDWNYRAGSIFSGGMHHGEVVYEGDVPQGDGEVIYEGDGAMHEGGAMYHPQGETIYHEPPAASRHRPALRPVPEGANRVQYTHSPSSYQ